MNPTEPGAKPKRHQSSIIRTGCLHCRAHGLVCDPRDPRCERYSSITWSSNGNLVHRKARRRLSPQQYLKSQYLLAGVIDHDWEGTHRERQSLHFFSVISAPELAGLIDVLFWQELLLQSTHHDHAIKHAVAAIGATHECRLREQAARYNGQTDALRSFALRQCNKSIQTLIRPVEKSIMGDLMRNLVAALLFASLESLNEGRGAALPHVVHARNLVNQIKSMAARTESGPFNATLPVDLDVIEPLITHYEAQTGHFYGDAGVPSSEGDQLDMRGPVHINSFAEARISLEKGLSVMQSNLARLRSDITATEFDEITDAKRMYASWCTQWGEALRDFLLRQDGNLATGTLRGCKLLRAHQLTVWIVASTDFSKGESTWADFTTEFQQILELITELIAASQPRSVAFQPPQTAYFFSTMGVTEPLYVVAARCTDEETAERARALLGRLPASEGAQSSWRISILEEFLRYFARPRPSL